MPRDSSGNFTLVAGNPVITGTTIASAWGNNTLTDIGSVLTASLDRSGNGSMLASLKILDGTVGAPGLVFGSEPTTGFYRPAGNQVALSIGGTQRLLFTTTTVLFSGQAVTLNAAPSGALTLALTGNSTQPAAQIAAGAGQVALVIVSSGSVSGINVISATNSSAVISLLQSAVSGWTLYNAANVGDLRFNDGSGDRLKIAQGGGVTLSSPSAGVTLSVGIGINGESVLINASATMYGLVILSASSQLLGVQLTTASKNYQLIVGNSVGNALSICDGGVDRLQLLSNGQWNFVASLAGNTVSIQGFNSAHSLVIADSATNLFNAGFLEVPIVGTAISRTCVLSDNGKSILPSVTGTTQTIPANSSVPYPIGTTLTFEYVAAGTVTIAINTDTLIWLGTGATGSRTLAQYGKATAHKIAATTWIISGVNIS